MDWLGLGIGFGITFAFVALGMAWRARLRGKLLLDTGATEGPVLSRNPPPSFLRRSCPCAPGYGEEARGW